MFSLQASRPLRWGSRRVPNMLFVAILLVSFAAVANVDLSETTQRRYLDGLYQRGLFRLAETYCREQLHSPDLGSIERAELLVELSRCLTQQATAAPREQRAGLWQEAIGVVDDIVRAEPEHPRALLIRLQAALVRLTRGELLAQEARLSPRRQSLREAAKPHLREAIRLLTELADDTQRQIGASSLHETGGLTSAELSPLQKAIQYHLARAYRSQAECYDESSNDRANALTRAIQQLELLARLDPTEPNALAARLDLATCHRLSRNRQAARRQLDAIAALEPPPAIALEVQAEQLQLALAENDRDGVARLLDQGRTIDGITSPKLDVAWLEAYLMFWQEATERNDEAKASRLLAEATRLVAAIENEHGPYWMRRAEMMLADTVQTSSTNADIDTLIRAAESFYRSGQYDEALTTYDQAVQTIGQTAERERVFQLALTAASIEHKRNRHTEALRRYRQLALAMPDHPRAAEAHQLAIYHAAQLAKATPAKWLSTYSDLLDAHLSEWPKTASAYTVAWQLGQLRQHRRDWAGAIAAYKTIAPTAVKYADAIEAIGQCAGAWFQQLEADGQAVDASADETAAWFEAILVVQGQLPEKWTTAQRRAAVAAARLRLNHTLEKVARAESVLRAALDGVKDPPPEWQAKARWLLTLALAAGNNHSEAQRVLAENAALTARPTPKETLALLRSLARLSDDASVESQEELARLLLGVIEQLATDDVQFSAGDRRDIDMMRATSLARSGRQADAIAAFGTLAAAHPKDGAVQEAYARLLLEQRDEASWNTALKQWREIEKKSRPRSDRWFRAKYSIALLHERMGDKKQAAKIVTLLKVLHPDLGGPEMRSRFEELLRRCR